MIVSPEKAKVGTLVTRMSGDQNAKEDRIMKSMIGKISILVLATIMLALSCAQEKGKVTLMLGGAPAEMDYWEETIADFSSRTGIPVELMRQPTDTDQRRQSLLVPLKAGESDPDVFLMDIIWIGQFAASNWLEPLDPLIIRDGFDLGPFFGGITFSIRSVKMMSPTRSLFRVAENARSAQSSAASSALNLDTVPKAPDALASTTNMIVSSRSSSNFLT